MAAADAAKFWDKIAPKYARDPIKDMQSYEITLDKTRGYLEADHTVLEIGAGTGSTALLLAKDCAQITATDLSAKMLDVGREKAWNEGVNNVSFEVRRAEDMPDGPFDAVLAHNILHLVEDLPAVLARAHAVLKPGGVMISKTFVKPRSGLHLEYRAMKIALPIMQFFGKAPFVAFHTRDAFEAAFRQAGFEVVESGHFPAGQERLYTVARKP
jgi:ubiquinone/menaquinone biosynthesis C-methylase UbiE